MVTMLRKTRGSVLALAVATDLATLPVVLATFFLLGTSETFADNALLFTAIAMLIEAPRGAWYVPALQSCGE